MVALPGDVLRRYSRFSRYNSPYPEHDAGTAVDLYPDRDDGRASSPVAGEVVETRTVRCPPKPYAVEHDHLIVVDTGDHLARTLHVNPTVECGDHVAVGDALGHTVRSGFFAPWVANHLHVAFRDRDANPVRATGSLPLDIDVAVTPVTWDGRGTVVETGETWALLDQPAHPAPGEHFAGLATDDGRVLDGGFPHYDYGGIQPRAGDDGDDSTEIPLLGTVVGDVSDDVARGDHRSVDWHDCTVTANGDPITGLSLFCGRDWLGAKLVAPGHRWAVGDEIRVELS